MKAIDARRRLDGGEAGQEAADCRQEELELVVAAPAESRPKALAKVQYIIQLLSALTEAQDSGSREGISLTLDCMAMPCESAKENS